MRKRRAADSPKERGTLNTYSVFNRPPLPKRYPFVPYPALFSKRPAVRSRAHS
jgi:hypothetical protein